MTEHAIPNAAEFVGEWTLPETSGGRGPVPGSLSWSGSRATLRLNDALTPLRGAIFGDEVRNYSVVHGVTVESKLVSLLEAMAGGAGIQHWAWRDLGRGRRLFQAGWLSVNSTWTRLRPIARCAFGFRACSCG